jgi:hypothetical protein
MAAHARETMVPMQHMKRAVESMRVTRVTWSDHEAMELFMYFMCVTAMLGFDLKTTGVTGELTKVAFVIAHANTCRRVMIMIMAVIMSRFVGDPDGTGDGTRNTKHAVDVITDAFAGMMKDAAAADTTAANTAGHRKDMLQLYEKTMAGVTKALQDMHAIDANAMPQDVLQASMLRVMDSLDDTAFSALIAALRMSLTGMVNFITTVIGAVKTDVELQLAVARIPVQHMGTTAVVSMQALNRSLQALDGNKYIPTAAALDANVKDLVGNVVSGAQQLERLLEEFPQFCHLVGEREEGMHMASGSHGVFGDAARPEHLVRAEFEQKEEQLKRNHRIEIAAKEEQSDARATLLSSVAVITMIVASVLTLLHECTLVSNAVVQAFEVTVTVGMQAFPRLVDIQTAASAAGLSANSELYMHMSGRVAEFGQNTRHLLTLMIFVSTLASHGEFTISAFRQPSGGNPAAVMAICDLVSAALASVTTPVEGVNLKQHRATPLELNKMAAAMFGARAFVLAHDAPIDIYRALGFMFTTETDPSKLEELATTVATTRAATMQSVFNILNLNGGAPASGT